MYIHVPAYVHNDSLQHFLLSSHYSNGTQYMYMHVHQRCAIMKIIGIADYCRLLEVSITIYRLIGKSDLVFH